MRIDATGVLLSGGLDSSAVTAMADRARELGAEIRLGARVFGFLPGAKKK